MEKETVDEGDMDEPNDVSIPYLPLLSYVMQVVPRE
jgi:hypothetical protein